MEKIFLIDEEYVNTRLDRWFKRKIFKVPQSLIEKNIRKGNIKVNLKKIKSSYRLKQNDKVIIKDLSIFVQKKEKTKFVYKATKKEISSTSDIFIENNENFAVINKPSGIAVQSGTKSSKNILDILRSTKEFDGVPPFSVHRLDKETTGVLIVAKNRKFAQLFTSLFRIRKIHKTYMCIVHGQLEQKKGTFNDILFYYEGKKKITTKAITHFQVIDSNINCSLLKLNPQTGRKHQLRKQLLIRGHPVVGDTKYNIPNKAKNKSSFLMLHAQKLSFFISGAKHSYEAELPLLFRRKLKEKYLKTF